MNPVKRSLFGMQIDAVRMPEAVARVASWARGEQSQCRYVVTPNVDHAVILNENQALRAAYAEAALILPDGHPLVWASRLLGQALPERVPGSDLVPALFSSWQGDRKLTVFLLGAAPGVAGRAAVRIGERWPRVETVGVYSPPPGFEHDPVENEKILRLVAAAAPDVLVLGLGAPKQEIWIHRHHRRIQAKVALCVGATIDFLAGEKTRAPRWMQSAGVEWLHRMCSEPGRLFKRYARDAWIFPQLVWQQWRGRPFHGV